MKFFIFCKASNNCEISIIILILASYNMCLIFQKVVLLVGPIALCYEIVRASINFCVVSVKLIILALSQFFLISMRKIVLLLLIR